MSKLSIVTKLILKTRFSHTFISMSNAIDFMQLHALVGEIHSFYCRHLDVERSTGVHLAIPRHLENYSFYVIHAC